MKVWVPEEGLRKDHATSSLFRIFRKSSLNSPVDLPTHVDKIVPRLPSLGASESLLRLEVRVAVTRDLDLVSTYDEARKANVVGTVMNENEDVGGCH